MSGSVLAQLVSKYQTRGVLVDANILLLYMVGGYDRKLIDIFKRTQTFNVQDYKLVAAFLSVFRSIVTTPNILTEVSNLSAQLPTQYFERFRLQIQVLNEAYVPSATASSERYFARCGLTDAGIMALAKDRFLVLTDDFRLSNVLAAIGVDCINFNHIRTFVW